MKFFVTGCLGFATGFSRFVTEKVPLFKNITKIVPVRTS